MPAADKCVEEILEKAVPDWFYLTASILAGPKSR
jgi:hypothetical protein